MAACKHHIGRDTSVIGVFVFKDCHDGVGGFEAGFVRGVGVRGFVRGVGVGGSQDESLGGASGGRGGKGEESNDQHGGKVWRFEAVDGNGGIVIGGKLALEDIDGNGAGGVDEVQDWNLFGNSGIIVGTEDCRVVVVEDCRTGGKLQKLQHCRRITHAHLFGNEL